MELNEHYNHIVLKYCSLAAWKPEILSQVKPSWFHITVKSTFVFKFVSLCIERKGKYDDLSAYYVREHCLGEIQDYVDKVHKSTVSILHIAIYEELDKYQNDVLRDIAQKDHLIFDLQVSELRSLVERISDTNRFELSLANAKDIVKRGGSIEEATLQIYYPESATVNHASFVEQAKSILSDHNPNPLMTGVDVIDHHGGLEKKNILVLGGDTGAMKTRSTLWLCLQMLIHNPDEKCLYFQREMTKRDMFYMICSYLMSTDYLTIRQWSNEFLLAKLEEQDGDMMSIVDRFVILDTTDFRTAEDVFYLVNKYKPGFWVIDFVTMMVGSETGAGDTNQAVYNIVDKFKTIAQRTDSLGILISQIRKGTVESRVNKIPTMDDLEWSGRLKHIAAYAFTVFLPSYYDNNVPKRYFFIKDAKNRYGERFWVYLLAHPERGTFVQPELQARYEMESWIKEYISGRQK
jgi:replicative DNA helicase